MFFEKILGLFSSNNLVSNFNDTNDINNRANDCINEMQNEEIRINNENSLNDSTRESEMIITPSDEGGYDSTSSFNSEPGNSCDDAMSTNNDFGGCDTFNDFGNCGGCDITNDFGNCNNFDNFNDMF